MKIKERPEFRNKPKPVIFQAGQSVAEAVAVMAERNIGSVVITGDGGSLDGIMTERDLLRRLLALGRDPNTTTIGEIMTRELRVAQANDEVIDWIRQMSNDRFRHLPVVDENGHILAVMSLGDFISYTWPMLVVRVGETAKRAFFSATQANMIVIILVAYLVIILGIVTFR